MKHLTPEDKLHISQLLSAAIIAFEMNEDFEAYDFTKHALKIME